MLLQIRENKFNGPNRAILEHIQKIIKQSNYAMSVRQIHYKLVSLGCIENTLSEYRKVSSICTKGRYIGALDWDLISDETRGAYKTESYQDIRQSLEYQIKTYRKNRWADSEYYLETWVEKRTMTNIFYPVTNHYDIFLNVGGGFNSTSSIWQAVKRLMQNIDKKIIILYFGDLDPSGDFMTEDIETRLKEFNLDIKVERVLLTPAQVIEYDLPKKFDIKKQTRDRGTVNKLLDDPRHKRFISKYGELSQTEIEALDTPVIIDLLTRSIEKYLDMDLFNSVIGQEEIERDNIRKLLA